MATKPRQVELCAKCGVTHIGPHCPGTFSPSKEPHKVHENERAYQEWCATEQAAEDAAKGPAPVAVAVAVPVAASAPVAAPARREPSAADVVYGLLQSVAKGNLIASCGPHATVAAIASELSTRLGITYQSIDTGSVTIFADGSALLSLEGIGIVFVEDCAIFR